jgi:hypothetical protein
MAAEVAFEGAAEAAEFPAQREEARAELGITRRYALFQGTKPESLDAGRRWFADTGGVPLTTGSGTAASEGELATAFAALADAAGWRFTVLVALDAWEGWYDLARRLAVPVAADLAGSATTVPVIAVRQPTGHARWRELTERLTQSGRGLAFALHQPLDQPATDVAGIIGGVAGGVDLAGALASVHHPDSRPARRQLR